MGDATGTTVRRCVAGAACVLVLAAGCGRDGTSGEAKAEESPRPQTYGHGALATAAQRVVEIRMSDDLRFDPSEVSVKPGEVVTFRLINVGQLVHEFTIGGPFAQDLHAAQMVNMVPSETGSGAEMDMGDHGGGMSMSPEAGDDENQKALAARIADLDQRAAANASVHVPPGETQDLTWAFTGEQAPSYACHIAGHWAGGMKGTITIAG